MYCLQNYKIPSYANTLQFKARVGHSKNMNEEIMRKVDSREIRHFIPTPYPIIDMMIKELGTVYPTDKILEPSAGYGHMIDRLVERTSIRPENIDAIEPIDDLRKVLANKGYHLIGRDILQHSPNFQYDKIIMNPPFNDGNDVKHLLHCYDLLKPGGKLVAIIPESSFAPPGQPGCEKWKKDWFGTGEKKEINEYLADLLEKTESKTVKLGNAFEQSDVPDDVQTRMVVIKKPYW